MKSEKNNPLFREVDLTMGALLTIVWFKGTFLQNCIRKACDKKREMREKREMK